MNEVPADIETWIEENNALIVHWINRSKCGNLWPEDAYAAALTGVARAAVTYEPSKGGWNTHVSWQIRGEIRREVLLQRRWGRENFGFDLSIVADYRERPRVNLDLSEYLGKLDKRQRKVILHRYGLQGKKLLTRKQLGRVMRVTPERIRQIEIKATEKLRRIMWREAI